jgi:hypothetical protein
MKKTMIFLLLGALGALGAGAAFAQPSIGVSIGIQQPGIYGRINIGDIPRPALVLPQPVIIAPPRIVVERQPIYLYVPVEHQQNWRYHCGRYSACGQPVYFVQETWVRERYEHEHPGWERGRGHKWDKHEGKHEGKHGDKHEGKHKGKHDHDD